MSPEQVAEILRVIIQFGWLILAFIALGILRPHIGLLLSRVQKAKMFGGEIELRDELEKLKERGEAAAAEVRIIPTGPAGDLKSRELSERLKQATQSIRLTKGIWHQASSGPKGALMRLNVELESAILEAIAKRDLLRGRSSVPIAEGIEELRHYGIPPKLLGSLTQFDVVRNMIMHGRSATDEDVLSAIDSGITILKAVKALPNINRMVVHPGVDIFQDSNCTNPHEGKGIILETSEAREGAKKVRQIFPTTRTHFQKGKNVDWEWNMNRVWNDAWYRDPDTSEIKNAWGSSAEFVGRHIEDL